MSPNTPPVFETLPVEVLGNILKQIASPEDLYSTIRASPRAFGSFLWYREGTLIAVLQAGLPAEIFAEFLGLLHAPKFEDFNHVPEQRCVLVHVKWAGIQTLNYDDKADSWFGTYSALEAADRRRTGADDMPRGWDICKSEAWPDLVNCFFERHFENVWLAKVTDVQRYSTPQPADKREVNYLMSTYSMLKRFIWDYQLFVQTNMTDTAPQISDLGRASSRRREAQLDMQGAWPPLSENETLRLYRGFLRYELCCRVNIIPDRDALEIKTDFEDIENLYHPLSDYLYRWEEEEVRCVWTYVRKQYQILVRDTVADFRCDIRRLSRKPRVHSREAYHAPAMAPGLDKGKDHLGSWAYNMSCYGLPLLQQLLRSELDAQRRFLKNTTCWRIADYEAFELLQHEKMLRFETRRRSIPITPRNGRDANPVYMPMIRRFPRLRWLQAKGAETGLKEHGWIFWEDPKRLERFLLLEPVPTGGFCTVRCHSPPVPHAGFEAEVLAMEEGYPEQTMYVTKKDYKALSAKYEAKRLTPKGDRFFLNRLRAISDQPSKEALPVFQEVCSGIP